MEDLFENHFPGNDHIRHITGMLAVGLMFTILQRFSGHYYIEGVGYATIQDILTQTIHGAGFLLLLMAMKLVATALTIGSGGLENVTFFWGALPQDRVEEELGAPIKKL